MSIIPLRTRTKDTSYDDAQQSSPYLFNNMTEC